LKWIWCWGVVECHIFFVFHFAIILTNDCKMIQQGLKTFYTLFLRVVFCLCGVCFVSLSLFFGRQFFLLFLRLLLDHGLFLFHQGCPRNKCMMLTLDEDATHIIRQYTKYKSINTNELVFPNVDEFVIHQVMSFYCLKIFSIFTRRL
jgi:hypothetical protein